MNPNPVFADSLAAAKNLKNARKNQIGGWVFFGIGIFSTVVGLASGKVYLLWTLLGVLGLVYALRSGRNMAELKAAVATANYAVTQAQRSPGHQIGGGQFDSPNA